MTQIAIPQSVQDYMHQPGVRSAVDHLLETGTADLPQGLERWDEVRAFHRAYLSACQVRTEHALLLMDVWEAVWGQAVAELSVPFRPLTPIEQNDVTQERPASPDDLWKNHHAYRRVFVTANERLGCVTGVYCGHDIGLVLYFCVYNTNGGAAQSNRTHLPEPWSTKVDEFDYRWTQHGFMLLPNAEAFDVSILQEVAAAALTSYPWPVR